MRVLNTQNGLVTAELTDGDVRMLSQALNEVLHGPEAIEEWEFQTRMGVTREEAKNLLDSLPRESSGA